MNSCLPLHKNKILFKVLILLKVRILKFDAIFKQLLRDFLNLEEKILEMIIEHDLKPYSHILTNAISVL
jgi:hypothetical protein